MNAHRIVIVGGGIIGAAIFQRLSRAWGREVVMIEKSRPGQGATAFSGGIVRAFHLDPLLADQCAQGLQFYRDLAHASGGEFQIHRTGFLQLIDEAHHTAAREAFANLSGQVALEWMTADAAASRFKLASSQGLCAAVYEPEAGHVDPLSLARLLTHMGQRDGGIAMPGVELHGISTHNGVTCGVETNLGHIVCEQVVVCTGAWTPELGRRLGVRTPFALRSKAIQINLVSREAQATAMPAFVDLGSDAYGRPHGADAAFIGCPVDAWDIDPDIVSPPRADARTDALARARQRFAWLDNSQALGGYRRHDAYDATGRGVVAWADAPSGVLIAAGFSGNGVKLAPAAAQAVTRHLQACTELALPA